MARGHFIITGTSKGIGEQLAGMLLDLGHQVIGIARGNSERLRGYSNYTHRSFDLSDIMGVDVLLKEIVHEVNIVDSEIFCLINNAAMLEPLKPIERCTAQEIQQHLQVSLAAPMVATSSFIRYTEYIDIRRKIINITSGSGTYPAPGMSAYCTAKAGINMFTQCVGAEQANQPRPVEIIAVDPGMVETQLQAAARGKDEEDFGMVKYFKQAYESGQVQPAEELGRYLLKIIENEYPAGELVHYTHAEL
ncbi:SDR family NAD(P)-dependent oxidoreductase [Paenibacillus woosongensis]|uniref:SDR family NAD(P)-dependent oxidoreductase n=1 Tax=Paenibacillus woosongensis TaxID=307580 RepID=A0A7X3CQZ7_9BACL|nr:SDR family NAD(P)-dependent oxidoreductase [Paenibacillus woosongensis]MUG47640.1 SDR family NAD(P)-dependent oxidoreductase [Paenibacillus woosongensis]